VLIENGFDPGDRLHPLFANGPAGQYRALRVFRKTVLALTATVIGTAALALEDPVAPLADFSASLIDAFSLTVDQASAAVQPAVVASGTRPADSGVTARIATAAASEAADPPRTEADESASDDGLLKQFLAWSHDQEVQEQLQTQQLQTQQLQAQQMQMQASSQPVEPAKSTEVLPDVSTRIMQPEPAPTRVAQKPQRSTHTLRNARAEVQSQRQSRTRIAPAHQATPLVRSVENVHSQVVAPESAEPPSLLQMLGWRN
jgi:hypothetical protein